MKHGLLMSCLRTDADMLIRKKTEACYSEGKKNAIVYTPLVFLLLITLQWIS